MENYNQSHKILSTEHTLHYHNNMSYIFKLKIWGNIFLWLDMHDIFIYQITTYINNLKAVGSKH